MATRKTTASKAPQTGQLTSRQSIDDPGDLINSIDISLSRVRATLDLIMVIAANQNLGSLYDETVSASMDGALDEIHAAQEKAQQLHDAFWALDKAHKEAA